MATLFNADGTISQAFEDGIDAPRVVVVPRGTGFSVSGFTGTIAAALGANSAVFAMRLDPSATNPAHITQIKLSYVTIGAYSVPVTAGRRLSIFRGAGANAAVGTAISAAARKDSNSGASEFDSAQGGDMRISATATLTQTGITWETIPFAEMNLVGSGTAGALKEEAFNFCAPETLPILIQPGQLLGIRNPQAMDAAGTWQLGVTVNWVEAPALVWTS
jgi:hypothetical protein